MKRKDCYWSWCWLVVPFLVSTALFVDVVVVVGAAYCNGPASTVGWQTGVFSGANPDYPCGTIGSVACAIDCTTALTNCNGITINCPEGVDCYIKCGGTTGVDGACQNTVINCPQYGDCYVDCSSNRDESCNAVQVRCSSTAAASASCVLNCNEINSPWPSNICNNFVLDCNTAATCTSQCNNNIDCTGGAHQDCGTSTCYRYCDSPECQNGCSSLTCGTLPAFCPTLSAVTPSMTLTATRTASQSTTPSSTRTPSSLPSQSNTLTPTRTASFSPSETPTQSVTATVSVTASRTPSVTSTRTPSSTVTATVTATPSVSSTWTPSATATRSASISLSADPSSTATTSPTTSVTISASGTVTRSGSVTPSVSMTVTPTSSQSNTPSFSTTPTRSVTLTPTRSVTFTPTSTRTQSTSNTLTPSSVSSPTVTGSPSPVVSETPISSSSPSRSFSSAPVPSSSPSRSNDLISGLTCQGIPCPDDDNLCTRAVCVSETCTQQPVTCDDFDLCTIDTCSPDTGGCLHEPIPACGEETGDCRSISDCSSCEAQDGCSWLRCSRLDSGLANITTIQFNNKTGLSGFFVHSRLKRVEKVVEVWFVLRNMSVFIVDTIEFISLGSSQTVLAECLPDEAIGAVEGQYESNKVVCDSDTNCQPLVVDQLEAQVATISTAIGAAGGGGIGCFCGSCVIALLFFRRKKTPSDIAAAANAENIQSNMDTSFVINEAFLNADTANPLFEG